MLTQTMSFQVCWQPLHNFIAIFKWACFGMVIIFCFPSLTALESMGLPKIMGWHKGTGFFRFPLMFFPHMPGQVKNPTATFRQRTLFFLSFFLFIFWLFSITTNNWQFTETVFMTFFWISTNFISFARLFKVAVNIFLFCQSCFTL